MNYLEIIGTLLGLLYLWFEYRASTWVWVYSIAMPAVYLKVYWDAGLYADFGINLYYIIASIYGLIIWLRPHQKDNGNPELGITTTPPGLWWRLAAVAIILFFAIGWLLKTATDSTVPYADAATTALSIVAMWMLAKKYLEQWLVWLIVDIGCAALYWYKDLPFTGGLYLAYAAIAVFGYAKWRRMIIHS